MKITIIHGQSHKGTTYHLAMMLSDKLEGDVKEFFLPRDFGSFCIGCNACFSTSEKLCPHYEQLKPITAALDEADLIILTSPVYVYHVTGAIKAFLDHYGHRWIVHRPNDDMFFKQAVCMSIAAGAGMKSTNKDMADNMFFWGIAKIYKYGIRIKAVTWDDVKDDIRKKMEKDTEKLAKKIKKNQFKLRSTIKTKMFFYLMRLYHKNNYSQADRDFWNDKGWMGKVRPWKR